MKQRCYNTLTFGLGCLLIIGGLSVRGQQRPGKPQADTPRLQLNQPQTREIKAGETHSYHIALQAGEFVQVEAMQQGVDAKA